MGTTHARSPTFDMITDQYNNQWDHSSTLLWFLKKIDVWYIISDVAQTRKSLFVCKFNQQIKADSLVERVKLIHTNLSYAFIKYTDGRESSLSLRDLAPCPESTEPEVESSNSIDVTHCELFLDPSIEEVTAPTASPLLEQLSSTVELSKPSLVPVPSDQSTSTAEHVEPSQSMSFTKAPPKSYPFGLRESSRVSK